MNESPNITIEVLRIITEFLSENSISIVLLVLLVINRRAISDFISRLTSLSFKKGDSQLGMQAAVPTENEEKVQELKSAVEKPDLDDESSDIEDKTKGGNWFSEIHTALNEGRIVDAEKAFKKYALDEKDESKLIKNKAMYLYLRFEKGKDNSAIDELEELIRTAKTEDSKFDTLMWLSFCLNNSMQNKKEIELWRTAAKETEDQSLVTSAIVSLSHALNNEDESNEARQILIDRLSDVQEEKQISSLYAALSKIELSLGNKSISVYCKDKSLEYDPNNRDELFNSAYAASDENIEEVSISNYVRLIRIDNDNSTALNNLGVRAQEAGLKIKAIDNYKRSSGYNNTLAMANQGYLLLGAGFTEEAEEITKKALELDDTHQNVYSLITAINEKKEEQSKEWEKLTTNALARQKLMRRYVEQYYLGQPKALGGDWLANNRHPTNVAISGDLLKATWSEEGGALGGVSYTVELTGEVTGSTFTGTYTRKRIGDAPRTLLGISGDVQKSCIGFVSEDKENFNIVSSKLKEDFSLCLSRPKA